METSVTLPIPSLIAPNTTQVVEYKQQKQELQVGTVLLYGVRIVSLVIEKQERLCLAQISNTLLKQFSYNEIHNRRVALGITCVQCTPVQLEILRRAGAMPVSSRRCGMITRREAERLCKSFLCDNAPPRLPEDFAFLVHHECSFGCKGAFVPARYNSSRAKCIKCAVCGLFFSPNKFIFHSHQTGSSDKYVEHDAANFNSWRRHMKLSGEPPDEIVHAWEDVKAMFNGGTRKRIVSCPTNSNSQNTVKKQLKFSNDTPSSIAPNIIEGSTIESVPHQRVPSFTNAALPLSSTNVIDYMWHQQQQVTVATASKTSSFSILPYLPWLTKRNSMIFPSSFSSAFANTSSSETLESTINSNYHQSAFHPFIRSSSFRENVKLFENKEIELQQIKKLKESNSDDEVDVETTEEEAVYQLNENNIHSSLNCTLELSNMNIHNIHSNCWSPPRESEKDAEKSIEKIKFTTDVKAEFLLNKCTDNWQNTSFFGGSNVFQGITSFNSADIDCSSSRPEEFLFKQMHTSSTSIN